MHIITVLLLSFSFNSLVSGATVAISPNPAFVPLAPCPCDLTANQFDNNCCCDPDATANDIAISNCYTGAFAGDNPPVNDKSCFSNVSYNDDVYPLLCVYYFNTPSLGQFYSTVPDDATDPSTVVHLSYSYSALNVTSIAKCGSACYFSGDAILLNTSRIITFPQNAQSGNCLRKLPINYLQDTLASCSVVVDDSTCTSESVLDPKTYNISNINGGRSNVSSSTTITPSLTYIEDTSNSYVNSNTGINDVLTESLFSTSTTAEPTAGSNSPPSISSNNATCENAAVKVVYEFTWIGQQITALNIQITYATVPYTTLPTIPGEPTQDFVVQLFESTFVVDGAATATTVIRSGNPGYEFGLPVISGNLDTTTNIINASAENQLRVWSPGPGGRCNVSSTISPSFGYDLITGCTLAISSFDCADLLTLVEFEQESTIALTDYVARYGNPSYDDGTEWIEIIRNLSGASAAVNASEGQCANIPANLYIEFLWAKTGKIDGNDINEIVGAKVSWQRETWTLPCAVGVACTPSIFAIYSTVTFTEVSAQTPEPVLSSEINDTKSCDKDSTCWSELLLPLKSEFYANFFPADVAKSLADQNTAWTVLIALFVIGFTLIPQNWKKIGNWSRQFFPI